ncbi:hypothetical protein DFJ43DRAFT_999034, partial [Lentinula guzmanii]
MVDDLPEVEPTNVRPFCQVCAKAKSVRHPFPKESHTEYTGYGDKVVSDLWGPARHRSFKNSEYFQPVID